MSSFPIMKPACRQLAGCKLTTQQGPIAPLSDNHASICCCSTCAWAILSCSSQHSNSGGKTEGILQVASKAPEGRLRHADEADILFHLQDRAQAFQPGKVRCEA